MRITTSSGGCAFCVIGLMYFSSLISTPEQSENNRLYYIAYMYYIYTLGASKIVTYIYLDWAELRI